MRAVRCLLAAAALVAAAPMIAPAQQSGGGLSTDPRISEVTASPGGVAGDRVRAINLTGRSLRVGVLVRDLGAGGNGEPISVPQGTGARSAAQWVTVNPSQFELGAGATRDVAIRLSVPAGTAPGGYYASVLLDAAGVEARPSSEHLILVRVPGPGAAPDARIVRFKIPTLSVGGPVNLSLEVANAGNIHAVVGGTIQINDTFGNRVGTLGVPNAIVLPGHQRLFTVRWAAPPPLARIRAVATLQLAGKNGTAAASGFSLAWWVIAAAAGAFALPTYGLARKRRRRRRKEREAAEAAKRPAPPVVPLAPTSEGAWPGAPPEKEKARRFRRGRAESELEVPAPVAATPPKAPASPRAFEKEPEPSARDFAPSTEKPPPAGVPKGPAPVPSAEEPSWAPVEESEEFEEWLEAVRSAESDLEVPRRTIEPRQDEELAEDEELILEQPDEDEHPIAIARRSTPEPPAPVARPQAPVARPPVPPAKVVPTPVPVVRPPVPIPHPPVPIPQPPVTITPPPAPERPVPVARAPEPEHPAPVELPAEPEWPEAAWPDHEPASVPSDWQAETSGETLTGAAALRRAKVALDMLAGPTGETGAILDAGLELLRSVASDPSVVSSVQGEFAKTKGRRKQGPLALALWVVSAPEAPAALLAAYATAPKVVADRMQAALVTYDSAELRSHPALVDSLPPARRYSLGL